MNFHQIDEALLESLREKFPALQLNLEADGTNMVRVVVNDNQHTVSWDSRMAIDLLESTNPVNREVGRDARKLLKDILSEQIQTLTK